MPHPIHRVRSFDIEGPHIPCIEFDDGTAQTIDFQPILAGELFGPLRDLAMFNRVRIDPEVHTLVWPNGADFDPATLHDWPLGPSSGISVRRDQETNAAKYGASLPMAVRIARVFGGVEDMFRVEERRMGNTES
jgi:hypothetical protein